jgi:large subunit ribosomal protein L7/L12
MMGVHGLGWQIGSWAGSLILVLLLVGGAVVALDQKFGWGLTDPPSDTPDTPRAHTQRPEDVLGSDAPNYGVAESRSSQEAERGMQEQRGQWQQQSDDPLQPPGDASAGVPPDGGEQTEFAVVLQDAGAKKIKVIKVIRAATELDLREAKALVDEVPNIVKEDLSREEAEALKAELEIAGATVELW